MTLNKIGALGGGPYAAVARRATIARMAADSYFIILSSGRS
jgi:hypothetical protein